MVHSLYTAEQLCMQQKGQNYMWSLYGSYKYTRFFIIIMLRMYFPRSGINEKKIAHLYTKET